MTHGVLPVRWTAPEGLADMKFSSASDVWSYGVTCVEIIQDGLVPYVGVRSNPALIALITGGEIHPRPDGCSDVVYAVLTKCWSFEPRDRPSFHELRDFFQKATPAVLNHDPHGGIFLPGGSNNQYTALEGGGGGPQHDDDGGGYASRFQPPCASSAQHEHRAGVHSGGGAAATHAGQLNDGDLNFGFGEEAADFAAAEAPQADANLTPYGQAVVLPPRASAGMRRQKSVPKLYSGGNVGPGMRPTEYLPVGKPTGIHPSTKLGGGIAAAPENFDGFYEDAPDLAAHDQAVREARANASRGDGNGGMVGGGAFERRTEHIQGIGDVDVYTNTEPNPRDSGGGGGGDAEFERVSSTVYTATAVAGASTHVVHAAVEGEQAVGGTTEI